MSVLGEWSGVQSFLHVSLCAQFMDVQELKEIAQLIIADKRAGVSSFETYMMSVGLSKVLGGGLGRT